MRRMSPSEMIELLGGTSETARKAGVKPPSVSEWKQNGIPADKLILLGAELEQRSGGAIQRKALRPHDWHRIWPELVNTEGAPPVPTATEEVRDAA